MKRIIVTAALIACAISLVAQEQKTAAEETEGIIKASIKMMVKGYKDNRMVLRWSVDETAAWPFMQHTGVWIDYVVLDENNKYIGDSWTRLNPEPVMAWPADKLKQLVTPQSDENLLIAAQALYGSIGADTDDTNMGGIMEGEMAYSNIISLAMLAADRLPQAADVLGLRYEYKVDINSDYKYGYRIYPAGTHPLFEVDTAYYLYPGGAINDVRAPSLVQARGKDGYIEIYWPKGTGRNNFTYYNVERSEDGKTFHKIHEKPLVFNMDVINEFVYADSVQNYKTWYYRVNGIDAFGDESYWCPTVWAMGRNLTPPTPVFLSGTIDKTDGVVQLKWQTPPDEDLKGYVIRRGRSREVLDEAVTPTMLPPTTTTYTDKPDDLVEGVYYQLLAVDTALNYSYSNIPYFFVHDTIPPLPPTGLKGSIDTTGVVRLSWNLDYDDNVYAYRVFVSNNIGTSFSPASSALVEDTVFVDSISRTLTNREIYYRVLAIDGNNNQSPMSNILVLKRPKFAPSPAPVIGLFTIRDEEVSFDMSVYPDEENVAIYIFRKEVDEEKWVPIDSIPPNRTSYTDNTVEAGKTYQYMLRTKDIFNMYSHESFPLEVYVYRLAKNAPDIVFKVSLDKNTAKLNWVKPKEPVSFYILYKDSGKGLMQYKSFNNNEFSFSETIAGKTRYGIQAVYDDNDMEERVIESNWMEVN
ncbi:MAG: fibronectin type III domain-containing protein [Fermentimonas sp.]